MTDFTEQDLEKLSAYLDGMLDEPQRAALENQLAQDDTLRAELDALRQTIALVRALPILRAPRNFTLTAEMVSVEIPQQMPAPMPTPQTKRMVNFPAMTLLSAAASFIFVVLGAVLLLSEGGTSTITSEAPIIAALSTPTVEPEIRAMQTIEPALDVAGIDSAIEEILEEQTEEGMMLFSLPEESDDAVMETFGGGIEDFAMDNDPEAGETGIGAARMFEGEPATALEMAPVPPVPPMAEAQTGIAQSDVPQQESEPLGELADEIFSQEPGAVLEEADVLPASADATSRQQAAALVLLIFGGLFALVAAIAGYFTRRRV